MSTYKATISYTNENGNTQHHVVHNITANSMVGATTLAMNDFFYVCGEGEIKKVIIELQQSTRKAVGDIYHRSRT